MNANEDPNPCIGVCTPELESGLCQGCGQPLTTGTGSTLSNSVKEKTPLEDPFTTNKCSKDS